MYTDRLSDHAVMKGEIALSKKKDPAHQSLPDWICRSAAFKEQLQSALSKTDFQCVCPNERLQVTKDIIRDVGCNV
eukprot:2370942-Karenia_brevis.AAC.1